VGQNLVKDSAGGGMISLGVGGDFSWWGGVKGDFGDLFFVW
jgi:hypothetical protein